MNAKQTQSRIQEIEGWLSAYRNGWVAYDHAHVQRLQRERQAILNAQAARA